ncbi:MAG: trypsin-like peptidase domain-containing protein [Elusimicrobia bacterium]|nr:trypsin-like peptidase domain-containing protein [Elusimicrobiota bacterium]
MELARIGTRAAAAIALSIALAAQCPATPTVGPAGELLCGLMGCVYGADDRREPHEVRSEQVRRWADSTVALFEAGMVTEDPESGQATLTTKPFLVAPVGLAGQVELCAEEPYRGQSKGAFCSGALVGEDLILTAGHCVESEDECRNGVKFVFGFRAEEGGQPPAQVPAGEVYGCSRLLARMDVWAGPDYALIQLDRPVRGHAPLRVRRSGTPPVGSPLTVIGHPLGLPTKIAGGASVRTAAENGFFAANLDVYGGNSGSPVLNTVTGEVEGVAVRAIPTFVYDEERGCAKRGSRMDDYKQGTEVSLVDGLRPLLPAPRRPRTGAISALELPSAGRVSFDGGPR